MIFRRDVLQRLGGLLLFGSSNSLVSPLQVAAATPEIDIAATIRVIVDLLVPADDLPGAVELGIDRQILVTATGDQPLADLLVDGIRWFDTAASSLNGMSFWTSPEADQIFLMESSEAHKATEGGRLFAVLRRRTMLLYYSHPQIIAAFSYAGPPQPQGFPDFELPPHGE